MYADLHGKVAIVTGGSQGIGKAIALALAREGVRLALCARSENLLRQTVDEIETTTHTEVISMKANMAKLTDIRRFVNAVIKKFERIDVLVNSAGGAHIGGLFETSEENWEAHLQQKLLGYIRMSREVVPRMKKNGGGKIINIIGMAGREPDYRYMVPGAIDAALLNFTKSLSKELEQDNIRVTSVNPATTETPLTEATITSLSKLRKKSPEEIRHTITASFPNGKMIQPEEIARIVLFLASE